MGSNFQIITGNGSFHFYYKLNVTTLTLAENFTINQKPLHKLFYLTCATCDRIWVPSGKKQFITHLYSSSTEHSNRDLSWGLINSYWIIIQFRKLRHKELSNLSESSRLPRDSAEVVLEYPNNSAPLLAFYDENCHQGIKSPNTFLVKHSNEMGIFYNLQAVQLEKKVGKT